MGARKQQTSPKRGMGLKIVMFKLRFPQTLPDLETAWPDRCFFGHTPTDWHSFRSEHLPDERLMVSAKGFDSSVLSDSDLRTASVPTSIPPTGCFHKEGRKIYSSFALALEV